MPPKTAGISTKHQELTRTLLDLAQTLRPGDRFPSQSELMRQFHVSDRTVLRSLDDLRRDGWIVRRHGIGTFVADPVPFRHGPQDPLSPLSLLSPSAAGPSAPWCSPSVPSTSTSSIF